MSTPRTVTNVDDFDTFTEEECRDWLAVNAGWAVTFSGCFLWRNSTLERPIYDQIEHPIPATLDEAAKTPDPKWTTDISDSPGRALKHPFMRFDVWVTHPDYWGPKQVFAQGPTERHARFKARCKMEFMSKP